MSVSRRLGLFSSNSNEHQPLCATTQRNRLHENIGAQLRADFTTNPKFGVENRKSKYQFPEPTMQTFFPGISDEFAPVVVRKWRCHRRCCVKTSSSALWMCALPPAGTTGEPKREPGADRGNRLQTLRNIFTHRRSIFIFRFVSWRFRDAVNAPSFSFYIINQLMIGYRTEPGRNSPITLPLRWIRTSALGIFSK